MLLDKNELKEFAFSQGAQLVALTGVDSYDDYLEEVRSRLAETGAGHEDYLVPAVGDTSASADESFFAQLSDPRNLLPGAKTIIILGVYAHDPSGQYGNTKRELRGKTARTYYYYPVIRQIAEKMVALLEKSGHNSIHGQHIPLKFVSNQTGLGVYGKNGILQHPQYGSFIALRNIITEADFTPDKRQRIPSPCEGCDKCLKACPTGALYAPYKVNPRLCMNPVFRREEYIAPLMRSKMQNWVVGCDICQEVCPSNKGINLRSLDPRAGFDSRYHSSHMNLDGFERTPALIPLLAGKHPHVIRRNAAIALGNIGRSNDEALRALNEQLPNLSPELKEYFQWAIDLIVNRLYL